MKKIRTDSDTNGKQMNGKQKDTVIDDGYYYEDTEKLGGYDKMAPGCTEKIQLENPDKKEYLVREVWVTGDWKLVVVQKVAGKKEKYYLLELWWW